MSDDLFNFEMPSFNSADNGFEMTSDFSDFEGLGTIEMETRIHKPKKEPSIKKGFVKASNAQDLVKKIDWSEDNFRYIAIVSGNFEFGDFIGQIFKTFEVFAKKMTISTLSLSENNIEMLGELVQADYVDEMQVIVSDYWYSHEKHNLFKMLCEYVDFEDKTQVAVCSNHTKVCIFETYLGKKISIYGSANLRSSGCLEQITIECDDGLYDFYDEFHQSIVDEYKTIDKSVRRKALWKATGTDGII